MKNFFKDFFLTQIDDFTHMIFKIAGSVGLENILREGAWRSTINNMKLISKFLYSVTIDGNYNIPLKGPAVICTKISSGLYPFLACIAVEECTRRKLYQVYNLEFFKVHALRSWLRYINAVPVLDGKLLQHDAELLKNKLAEGELIGLTLYNKIYGDDPQDVQFKESDDVIKLAREGNAPIVPIAIPDIDDLLNIKTGRFSLNRKISMHVLEPYEGHFEKDVKESFKDLQQILKSAGELFS
ncbi:MAG: hypothetical protein ACTSWN_15625 [Promethearchaeota archaeon]